MTQEQEENLFVAAFNTLGRDKRNTLLKELYKTASAKERIIDYVTHKKLKTDKGIEVGDYILLDFSDIYSFPSPSRQYYEDNNLFVDANRIRVKVEKISITSNYIYINLYHSMTDYKLVEISDYKAETSAVTDLNLDF